MSTNHHQNNEVLLLLEQKFNEYNHPGFVELDPISIPHKFSEKEDIEIAGFLAATLAWGKRAQIVKNCTRLLELMDNDPFRFTTSCSKQEIERLSKFVHRTFNGFDCTFFIQSLRNIYCNHGGLESVFNFGYGNDHSVKNAIIHFHSVFFEIEHLTRTEKHVANVEKGSAAKRINMYLRWMVRNDQRGVDFGIWKSILPADLYLPLDVHTARISRELGLLTRTQNDFKAVEEVTQNLRCFDSADPIKYDFALFGLGIYDQF